MAFAPSFNRARVINNAYDRGNADSLEILHADFGGVWPPHGLIITQPPSHHITFKPYSKLFSNETAHVSNQERDLYIHVNRLGGLSSIFSKSHKADTIAHENIHILQKIMIQQGLSNSFGQFYRHGVREMLRKNTSSYARYVCAEDELMVRIHLLVSHYYQDHGKIPLNQHEFLSLLHHEGVRLMPQCVSSLSKSNQGLQAIGKFFREPKTLPFIKAAPIRDINAALHAIDEKHKEKFCQVTLPALYGSLLEIYGDREGSRRMGYHHNISLTDMFLNQAGRIQYRIDTHMTPDTSRIKVIIDAMPPEQKDDIAHILEQGTYTHPLSGRTRKIGHESALLIAPLLPQLSLMD